MTKLSDSYLLDRYEQFIRECDGVVGIFLATKEGRLVAGVAPLDVETMAEIGLRSIGASHDDIRGVLGALTFDSLEVERVH